MSDAMAGEHRHDWGFGLTEPGLVRRRLGQVWRVAGGPAGVDRITPRETPIALSFDGRPHTVLMASPGDVEDLALGFTITEGVARFEAIAGVEIRVQPDGLMVDIRLVPGAARGARDRAAWKDAPAAVSAASSAWPTRCVRFPRFRRGKPSPIKPSSGP
jgi:hypothetical protein